MRNTIVVGNGINLHFRRGVGLASSRKPAREEKSDLCEFAGRCKTYDAAVKVIQGREEGDVSQAAAQVYDVCTTEARREQLCYKGRGK